MCVCGGWGGGGELSPSRGQSRIARSVVQPANHCATELLLLICSPLFKGLEKCLMSRIREKPSNPFYLTFFRLILYIFISH